MKSLKNFLYSSLLFTILLLTACVPSAPAATTVPPNTVPVQQPTLTLQPTAASTASPESSPAAIQVSEPLPTATQLSEPPPTSDAVPADWSGVLSWLTAHWWDDPTAVSPVITALNEAGWIDASFQQIGEEVVDFVLVDLSGDTVPEWVVTLHPPNAAPLSTPRGERPSGNLVIIGAEGVIFQVYAGVPQADRITPLYLGTADFTGDGFQEVVIETLTCGINTCYGKYNIMSYHFGYLTDIAAADMQDRANPNPNIAVEVDEPVMTFHLEYLDGDNITGLRKQAEWVWQNETFETVRLDVIDERNPTNLTDMEAWLTHFYQDIEMQRSNAQERLYLGGLWIVNSSGIIYKSAATLQKVPATLRDANSYLIDDLTGDGRLDIIIEVLTCDPGACSATYELVSGHNGPIHDLLGADHELSAATRFNPTAAIVAPGNLEISYDMMEGHLGQDNWAWDDAAGTLFRIPVEQGGSPQICSIAVSEGVTTYMRPSADAAVFSTVGYTEEPDARTADGWLGFDPGVAQAGNVGVFRMRWVHESETAGSGDCALLPVVVGPQANVCYAMIFIDTPVYEMPDLETAVIANLNFEDYAPAIGRIGDAWLQIDVSGTPA